MIREIKTDLSSFQLYLLFKDETYSFILDSGKDHDGLGKYSFIGGTPFATFKSKGDKIEIEKSEGEVKTFNGEPFEELDKLFKMYPSDQRDSIPFLGGGVGYFSYDLCHYIEKLPRTTVDDVDIPDCFMGFYDGIIAVDHRNGKVYASALGINEPAEVILDRLEAKVIEGTKSPVVLQIPAKQSPPAFKSNFSKPDYLDAINKIKSYIKAGDIYQANMTQRFECELEETPLELYAKLRRINPAPFAAFIDFGDGYIVSSSPERFIKSEKGIIEARPIKGTRPRGNNSDEDRHYREELLNSEKDRAELLMIVDLERNDLSKVAKSGTVKVPELFVIEEYATVFHLVATVRAEVKDGYGPIDCIKATFPGGSITGAPKIRAMEIIDELEPTQRNIYTGSIGFIDFNGDMDLNIVIRTVVCKDQKAYFQVGGGIVWDSDAEDEYQESLQKAKAQMAALSQ